MDIEILVVPDSKINLFEATSEYAYGGIAVYNLDPLLVFKDNKLVGSARIEKRWVEPAVYGYETTLVLDGNNPVKLDIEEGLIQLFPVLTATSDPDTFYVTRFELKHGKAGFPVKYVGPLNS
jgi:hypothetical protein